MSKSIIIITLIWFLNRKKKNYFYVEDRPPHSAWDKNLSVSRPNPSLGRTNPPPRPGASLSASVLDTD